QNRLVVSNASSRSLGSNGSPSLVLRPCLSVAPATPNGSAQTVLAVGVNGIPRNGDGARGNGTRRTRRKSMRSPGQHANVIQNGLLAMIASAIPYAAQQKYKRTTSTIINGVPWIRTFV